MPLACVLISRFPLAVEQRLNPQLIPAPTIVYDRTRVVEASAEAAGVYPDQPLRQAKALYPHAVFLRANTALYRETFEAMLGALETVSPLVEPATLGCAYVDLRGLEALSALTGVPSSSPERGGGGEVQLAPPQRPGDQKPGDQQFALAARLVEAVRDATSLLPSVGIAAGKFPARVAALRCLPGDAGIVPEGREAAFLRDQEVALLPVDPEIVRRLDALALHALGDVAALPQSAVEAQFRSAGSRIWQLASGIDTAPLRPRTPQESLSERLTFDGAVVSSEALLMAARQLLRRLARRLDRRAARSMSLQIFAGQRLVWERAETFRDATSDEARMALILKTRIEMLTLTEAVDTVVITLSGIGREAARQPKLLSEGNPHLDQLAAAIREIRARYGRPMVWRAVEVDPCSRHPEERSALIPFDA